MSTKEYLPSADQDGYMTGAFNDSPGGLTTVAECNNKHTQQPRQRPSGIVSIAGLPYEVDVHICRGRDLGPSRVLAPPGCV